MAVYGIDLGTTYSCIARYDDSGSVEALILNSGQSAPGIPSVVNFEDNGRPVVGYAAKQKMITRPKSTKAHAKREMDKEFCSEEIEIGGQKRKISPVEVQACILRHLLVQANILETGRGNKPITKAVITVPAQFNEQQRARTWLAAELAGIEPIGLLQEPTAAAVAYDIPSGNTALVFDLGGGTLDVSIVTNNAGSYKTISTPTGDLHLGGVDWDEIILNLVTKMTGVEFTPEKRKKLLNQAERAKILLSQSDDADWDITEDNFIVIPRSEFENASKRLLDRCMDIVTKAIENAKSKEPNLKIDFFLIVGGSSKMPMIETAIIKKFGSIYGKDKTKEEWLRTKDPDTAIAIGAAKYAQLLTSGDKKALEQSRELRGFSNVSDVSSHSYGIEVQDTYGIRTIRNIIKSTDGNGTTKHIPNLKLSKDTDEFSVEVFENDSNENFVPKFVQSRSITSKDFKLKTTHLGGTEVGLEINLDDNGMIHLTFTCEDEVVTMDVNNTSDELIDAQTQRIIEATLKLMK